MKRSFQALILVAFHAAAMLRVLFREKNRDKGPWRGMSAEYLLDCAEAELVELRREVVLYRVGLSTLDKVEAEAADGSSFQAMVVDNLRADEWQKRLPRPGPLWPVEK